MPRTWNGATGLSTQSIIATLVFVNLTAADGNAASKEGANGAQSPRDLGGDTGEEGKEGKGESGAFAAVEAAADRKSTTSLSRFDLLRRPLSLFTPPETCTRVENVNKNITSLRQNTVSITINSGIAIFHDVGHALL
ncbi:hypothetical protein DAEQUDRAFT_811075 [Daedalea quercina L-15889]|uniref:Uncharacterized protein n=1 Tax=Daedalea quercina L-15889 TaxID=1314783 RepID=A0A165QQF0_9APHY|nr:hypothetical protein DAEQUDRAFT_811075 [Daedalea quercina L-15889]